MGGTTEEIKVQVCVRSHYRELYRFPLHATELLTAGQLATGASVESSLESPRHIGPVGGLHRGCSYSVQLPDR